MLIFRGVTTFISTKNQHETGHENGKGSRFIRIPIPTYQPSLRTPTHHTDTPPMRISSVGSNHLGGSIRCPRSAVGLSCLNGTRRWYWMVITSMTFKMLLKKVLHFMSPFLCRIWFDNIWGTNKIPAHNGEDDAWKPRFWLPTFGVDTPQFSYHFVGSSWGKFHSPYKKTHGKQTDDQDYMGDNEMLRVMGVLIHGDAAFCGQATLGFQDDG